ncbi:MAG: ORF6N domain-containing protein, partial [Muribaculaceae bacterium]|nr:ORF6N domain-containing protein [Muribaculaceae bacterium]
MEQDKESQEQKGIESVSMHGNSDLQIRIESLIHVVRDQQVMLDSDLAKLYGVETKVLNQAVKRNIQRFPSDFMFQLNKEDCLTSQIVTSNKGRGGTRYMPYLFTENGVAMLSSVLRSERAIDVNIRIMRAFSAMRNFLMNNAALFQRMDQLEMKQLITD